MEKNLELQFMIFALVAVGFFVRRLGLVGETGQKSRTRLVTDVILPCNIFQAFQTTGLDAKLSFAVQVILTSLGVQAFCVVLGRLAFRRFPDAKCRSLRYATICSNAGFLGNPVAEGMYGPQGLILANLYLIPQRVMMWSSGLAIYTGSHDRKKTLKAVLTHPCILACVLGLGFLLLGWQLPPLLLSPIAALGRCNTGMSMLVVGMIVARLDPKALLEPGILGYTALRLVLIPALVYGACCALGFSSMVRGLCVILAAMPAGATTSILADRYDQDPAYASKLVIFSTLVSIPTTALWCWLLQAA